MKKYIANITAGLMAFTLLAGCNKGDGTSNAIPPAKEHTCSFTQEVVAPEYLKKGPTCTTPAMYYYSCTCGEKDKDFFTIGEARGHRGGTATATQKATCTVCGQEYGDYAGGTHTHAYTERVTTSKYLKSEATCGDPAVYYYACACGEVGTDTFEYGEPTGKHTGGTATATQKATCTVCGQEYGDYLEETHTHAYTEMVTTSKYLVSEATCGDPAVYHYSCACGEVGTNTFEYGEPTGEHTGGTATETQRATCTVCGQEYGDFAKPEEPEEHVCVFEMVVDAQYLRKKATCEYPASYYLSCTCGETSLEYFYNGAKEDHVELVPATELSRAICAVCEEEYGDFLPHDHVYTKRIVSAEYLKKAATCGTPAEYWLVCACGEKSTSLSYQAGDPTGKHEVGTPATTTSQAVCKNCLQPYGETLLSAVTNISISSGYTRYDLGTALSRKTEGFGTQFDTCIVEQQNGMSEADWQVQVKALKEMNLQNVRVRFYPEMYERGNDNNDPHSFDSQSASVDFNSLEMQHLYKLLDAFEENGVKVDLSWYGCRTTFASEDGLIKGSWLGGKLSESYNGLTPNWIVAPWKTSNPNEEFAESVAECLGYLFNEKGYTCINEYSIFPEPDGMFNPGTGKAMTEAQYKLISDSIEARLASKGIANKLNFSGPASMNIAYEKFNTTEASWGSTASSFDSQYLSKFLKDDGTSLFEKVTVSAYPFTNATSNWQMLKTARAYTDICNKYGLSFGIAECGTSTSTSNVSNADADKYDRAMFMARFFINMVNGGCTNIKYFVFSDCNYDSTRNELGLFKAGMYDFAAKPVWHTWSLICRYTDIGSTVYPIESADAEVCLTALKLPDGSWTYVVANTGASVKKIAIVNGREDRARQMNLYQVTEGVAAGTELKVVDRSNVIRTENGVAEFSVPANGVIVLSSKA